jgi:DNA processing protein
LSHIFDLVRLNLTGCVGAGRFRKLLAACPDTESIFTLGHQSLQEICNISARTARKILDDKYRGWAATELKKVEKTGCKLIAFGDSDYPALLTEIPDPPLVLYVRGQAESLNSTAIAIVGTRRASRYGRETARRIAGELAALGIVVVSGLALGIDGEAHRGALEAGGRTVAVLGTGVNEIYPSEHAGLSKEVEASGALVSEFPLGTKPRKENFPRRNRIISGLSRGVLVVEAPVRSGALITARTATEQGREVFAVPGRTDNPNAAGSHHLIRDGAKLTSGARDILEEIAPQLAEKVISAPPAPEAPPAFDLDPEERKVFEVLDRDPTPIDTIIAESGLEPSAVTGALLKLQLKQLVIQLPGSKFARK